MNNGLDVEKLAEEKLSIKEIDKDIKVKKKKKISFAKKKPTKKEPKLRKVKDNKFISIDVGTSFIKVVEGRKRKDKIQILNAAKIESSSEYVKNGDLHSLPNIVNLLKTTFAQKNMNTKDLVFVMGGNQIISREISVVYNSEISEKEFRILIANELAQYLPINMEDYDIQYKEIEKFNVDGQPRIKVLVVVCPRSIVKGFLKVADDIGEKKKPYALDITNNAITKIYNHVNTINGTKINKKEAAMFIDMGAASFNISILNEGVLEFMRSIQGSGFEIDRNIALGIGVHVKEAEDLKIEKCNIGEHNESEANNFAREIVAQWTDEIERIINFYGNKRKKRIDKIYIYGGTSKLKGLGEYIKNRVNIEVVKIETVDNIEISKSVAINNIDQYLNAIGTLLRL